MKPLPYTVCAASCKQYIGIRPRIIVWHVCMRPVCQSVKTYHRSPPPAIPRPNIRPLWGDNHQTRGRHNRFWILLVIMCPTSAQRLIVRKTAGDSFASDCWLNLNRSTSFFQSPSSPPVLLSNVTSSFMLTAHISTLQFHYYGHCSSGE